MLFKSISLWFMEIIFGYKFVGLVEGIWSFIVNAVYYLSSILLIISVVHFGQQRYTQITHQSNKLKKDSIISEDEVIETVYIKNTKIVNEEPIVTQSKKPKQGFKNFIHQMVNLFYLCILWSLRLLILAVLFPMVIAVVFGLFVWGMLVFLVLTKVPVIGFMFTTGMGLVLAASIIFIIFAFTFNLKLKAWRYSRIFSIMIITLILGGFGSIWSINELSQFEWVNSNSQEYTNHEYKMNEFDKIELINAWTNIEIDNSLEDQIMIKLSSEFNTNENPLSQVDQTLIVSMNAYSEVDEMNEFRNRIMQQFNALKEGKLVFQRDNNQNEVIIRVNEKNYKLLQDRLSYN